MGKETIDSYTGVNRMTNLPEPMKQVILSESPYEPDVKYDLTDPNVYYFVGESNIPMQSVSGQYYKMMMVGLLVNVKSEEILDAYISMISPVSLNFIRHQFIGRRIIADRDLIIESIGRYYSPIQKSIIAAYKSVCDRYIKTFASLQD